MSRFCLLVHSVFLSSALIQTHRKFLIHQKDQEFLKHTANAPNLTKIAQVFAVDGWGVQQGGVWDQSNRKECEAKARRDHPTMTADNIHNMCFPHKGGDSILSSAAFYQDQFMDLADNPKYSKLVYGDKNKNDLSQAEKDELRAKNVPLLPIKFLQIGVFRGDSLAVFAKYFKNAEIYGADINFEPYRVAYEGIKAKGGWGADSAQSVTTVEFDSSQHSPPHDKFKLDGPDGRLFDVIIDDGCHKEWCIEKTAEHMYDSLAPGGLYFVEDALLRTRKKISTMKPWAQHFVAHKFNVAAYLKK